MCDAVATGRACLCVLTGMLVAYLTVRRNSWFDRILEFLTTTAAVLPGIIAIGMTRSPQCCAPQVSNESIPQRKINNQQEVGWPTPPLQGYLSVEA